MVGQITEDIYPKKTNNGCAKIWLERGGLYAS